MMRGPYSHKQAKTEEQSPLLQTLSREVLLQAMVLMTQDLQVLLFDLMNYMMDVIVVSAILIP